jgi:hypothetical protein
VSRVAALLLLALALAVSLSGCETTAEKSAKLEREAKHVPLAQKGLSIARRSTDVKVIATAVLSGSEGAAAAVTLRNDSSSALRDVPIAITVKEGGGRTLFQNNAPGLDAALTQVAALPAHGSVTWVDDQLPKSATPASVSAVVGVAPAASGPEPRIEIEGLHLSEEESSGEASGSVRNRSGVTQQKLVVYVVARRAGRVLAAGRAVLPEVTPGASVSFQTFLVGKPEGAKLEASAPPTTFG